MYRGICFRVSVSSQRGKTRKEHGCAWKINLAATIQTGIGERGDEIIDFTAMIH